MNGQRYKEKVPLVGPPFLACDFLMHRALCFGKAVYENRISSEHRAAFLAMSRETHSSTRLFATVCKKIRYISLWEQRAACTWVSCVAKQQ